MNSTVEIKVSPSPSNIVSPVTSPSISPSPSAESTLKSQVTAEEIAAAEAVKNCMPGYQSVNGDTLKGIDVTSKRIETASYTDGKETGSRNFRWYDTLPKVYDSQCNMLSLADLKQGDLVNMFYFGNNLDLYAVQKTK